MWPVTGREAEPYRPDLESFQSLVEAVTAVRAQVVIALQGSRANKQLVAKASQQVSAATEALRLTQANLSVGTMTTLDVAQDISPEAPAS